MQPVVILQLLILLLLANGTPVIAKKVLGDRYSYPLDGNLTFADRRPLFGRSKTIRGIVLAVLVTTAGAPLIGLGWKTGFLVGSFAMAGDLVYQLCEASSQPAVEQPGEWPRSGSGVAVPAARLPQFTVVGHGRHRRLRGDVFRGRSAALSPALRLARPRSPLLALVRSAPQPMQRDFRRAVQPYRNDR